MLATSRHMRSMRLGALTRSSLVHVMCEPTKGVKTYQLRYQSLDRELVVSAQTFRSLSLSLRVSLNLSLSLSLSCAQHPHGHGHEYGHRTFILAT